MTDKSLKPVKRALRLMSDVTLIRLSHLELKVDPLRAENKTRTALIPYLLADRPSTVAKLAEAVRTVAALNRTVEEL